MIYKTKMISALMLMPATSLSHASYGQFKLDIPAWFSILIFVVILLLATPLLGSLWFLAKRLFNGVLSIKECKLLRVWAGFHFFYAACYFMMSMAYFGNILRYPEVLPIMVVPTLLLIGLGYISARFAN